MQRKQIRVVSWVVDRYDSTDRPVTPAEATSHFDTDLETARSCFDDLEANCLLKSVDGGGYRPTITARELLELDLDDDALLVLDTCPQE